LEFGASKDAKQKPRLLELLARCSSEKVVDQKLLLERVQPATNHSAGILAINASDWDKQKNRIRTALFYKQQKYNLMREESEGYAKLVTELNINHTDAKSAPDTVMVNIQALIGHFALDPNRVLAEIVGAFENSNPTLLSHGRTVFVAVLRQYKTGPTSLSNLLGFRFSEQEDSHSIPESLYNVAAVLIQECLVTLDEIFPHLTPEHAVMKAGFAKQQAAAKAKVVKKQKPEEAAEDLRSQLAADTKAGAENQKLGLCHACILVNDWATANRIMAQLPKYFATAWPPLRKRLAGVAQAVIEPLYRKIAPVVTKASTASTKVPVTLPLCTEFSELPTHLFPMLNRLGVYAHTDVILLTKVLRVFKACFVESIARKDAELFLQEEVEKVFQLVIMPSMSLVDPGNPAFLQEAWAVLELMPYQARYRMYAFWKNKSDQLHPEVLLAHKTATMETRFLMKRLSKENVKKFGRVLGKFSHSNPGAVFDKILATIQEDGYNNLIDPVVDALRYITPFAKDMLAYCVIEAISNPKKERLKPGDINIGEWLQTLSTFASKVFLKMSINMRGILQYVINKLKAREGFDLVVFQDIIKKLTGMERVEDVTDVQLLAMTGGLVLAEAGSFGGSKVTKEQSRATTRLKATLLDLDDNGEDLAVPTLILIAQQLSAIVFDPTMAKANLKLVSELYDQCSETFGQFCAFMILHVKQKDYAARIPSVKELCLTYKLPAKVTFHLRRPIWKSLIKAQLEGLGESDDSLSGYVKACALAMAPLEKEWSSVVPVEIWETMTPKFFVSFWTFSMYDLETPSSTYQKTKSKVKDELVEFKGSDPAPRGSRLKKEETRTDSVLKTLAQEEKLQKLNQRQVNAAFDVEKDAWILSENGTAQKSMIQHFIQHCILPRCSFSAVDAIYCAKFATLLHTLKTTNWSTVLYFDKLLADVSLLIASQTGDEARRYGRFLAESLRTLGKWHKREESYQSHCFGFPGFVQKVNAKPEDGKKAGTKNITYEDYRHVLYKWHTGLTKAFKQLLTSKDHNMITNAILVLNAVLPVFPRVRAHGEVLIKWLTKLIDAENTPEGRNDIVVMARMYFAKLDKVTASLVDEDVFHIAKKKAAAPVAKPSAPAAGSGAASPAEEDSTKPSSDSKEKGAAKAKASKSTEKGKDKDKDKDKKRDSKSSDADNAADGGGGGAEDQDVEMASSGDPPERKESAKSGSSSKSKDRSDRKEDSKRKDKDSGVQRRDSRKGDDSGSGKDRSESREEKKQRRADAEKDCGSSRDSGSTESGGGNGGGGSKKRERQQQDDSDAKEVNERDMKRKRDDLLAKKAKRDEKGSSRDEDRGGDQDRDRDRDRGARDDRDGGGGGGGGGRFKGRGDRGSGKRR
jgi:THO complex subunit 2